MLEKKVNDTNEVFINKKWATLIKNLFHMTRVEKISMHRTWKNLGKCDKRTDSGKLFAKN